MLIPRNLYHRAARNIAAFTSVVLLAQTNQVLAAQFQASVYAGGTSTTYNNIGFLKFNGEIDQLHTTNPNDTTATFGAAAAIRSSNIPKPFDKLIHEVSVGPEFFYFTSATTGDVWQYLLPEMNNLTYQISTTSYRLLGTNEITFNPITPSVYPFFEWGLGFAANQSSYQEYPRPSYNNPGLSLAKNTQYNFAYTLGGGIKVDISDIAMFNNPLLLSFRYLYASLGSSDVSNETNSLVISPIPVSFHTQAWVAGLTYLF